MDGKVIESDGKTENAQHLVALDPFTLAALMAHVETLNRERKDLGPDYQDHGLLFCWENGTPPHPDTITRRFKKLSAAAGLPEIDLHDVRHSYATAVEMSGVAFAASSAVNPVIAADLATSTPKQPRSTSSLGNCVRRVREQGIGSGGLGPTSNGLDWRASGVSR